jgi:hypothetical protein
MNEVIYIRGPFTILCNYCGRTYGRVLSDTEVAASAVLKCTCGKETKFENMPGPALRTT